VIRIPDRVRAFSFRIEREAFPNDNSVQTTLDVTWLYRNCEFTWSRPLRRRECRYHGWLNNDAAEGPRPHWDDCQCADLHRRWPKEVD